MTLIDSLYINTTGGATLLKLLIESLNKRGIKDIYFLFDERLDKSVFSNISSCSFTIKKASISIRKDFYLNNSFKYKTILCFSNIPPPIKIHNSKVIIYFHNDLFLNPIKNKIRLKEKFLQIFKKYYILNKNRDDYYWVVQTSLMKIKLVKFFSIDFKKINVYPFFNLEKVKYTSTNNKNTFVYISSNEIHKNHKNLIDSFVKIAKKLDSNIYLDLSIDKPNFIKTPIPSNLFINFHGYIKPLEVSEIYIKSNFAIFPSFKESFGLPLIEATNHGCRVIASDLPYVHEIIKPSLTFDPYSIESISNSILKAIETDNLPETKVLVENKLDNFIDFIISQDV